MNQNINDMSRSNKHTIAAQPPILVPTKVGEYRMNNGTNNIMLEAFPRGQASRWTQQPVLAWLESLSEATESADRRGPMYVDGHRLAEKLDLPPTQRTAMGNGALPTDMHDQSLAYQSTWNLFYLSQDMASQEYVSQIRVLSARFDIIASTIDPVTVPLAFVDATMKEYRTAQSRLKYTFGRILGQDSQANSAPLSEQERRSLLDGLYEETVDRLQRLIGQLENPHKAIAVSGNHESGKNLFSLAKHLLPQPSTFQDEEKAPLSKHELSKYMMKWLRENWTNPYPDDQGLVELAEYAGTSVQVISNWLINARTRKWRPALLKASALGRPADYLLQDSLNIFDGEPVCEIDVDRCNNNDAHYHHLAQHLEFDNCLPKTSKATNFDYEDYCMDFEEDEEKPPKRFRFR